MTKSASTTCSAVRVRPLPIVQLGDPVLWAKAKSVSQSVDLDLLISRMSKTLIRAQGVGLAAPQVGQSIRMFIMDIHPTKTRTQLPQLGQIAVINPKIVESSDEMITDWEGCLSVTTLRGLVFGPVPRPKSIIVTYHNQLKKLVKMEMSGLVARIFLHEYDHLEGILFIQRMHDLSKLVNEKTYLHHLKSRSK